MNSMGIVSIERIEPAGHLSKAVVHNGTVYLAGLIADDDSLDVGGQTKQVLDKIDRYLAEAAVDGLLSYGYFTEGRCG
jgi:enamine deaminase RidA (YjgF/YER057c/UK114 family)